MSSKLGIIAMLALSVSSLESHLAAVEYDAAELAEFAAAEAEGDNRKTALAAYAEAIEALNEAAPQEKAENVRRVSDKVSSLLTIAGIKAAGEVVTASMLSGGDATMDKLIKKGFIK